MLLEKGTIFSYSMLLEKSQNKKELINNINCIIQSIKEVKKSEKIADGISYLLKNMLNENEQKEILEKIKNKRIITK